MANVPLKRRQSRFIRDPTTLGEKFWRAAAKYYFLGEGRGAGRCLIYLANKGMYDMVDNAATQLEWREGTLTKRAIEGCMDCPDTDLQDMRWPTHPGDSTSIENINSEAI